MDAGMVFSLWGHRPTPLYRTMSINRAVARFGNGSLTWRARVGHAPGRFADHAGDRGDDAAWLATARHALGPFPRRAGRRSPTAPGARSGRRSRRARRAQRRAARGGLPGPAGAPRP